METSNTPTITEDPSSLRRGSMTEEEERERRASIQAIMRDPNLTPQERRKSIQSLMDGRRRSSAAQPNGVISSMGGINSMAAAAAMAAAEFVDSSDDDERGEDDISVEGKPKRQSGRRSSFFRRSSSQNVAGGSNTKSVKRRASLRDSFTMGFSKFGVKSLVNGETVAKDAPASDPNALSRKMEKSRPFCGHYQRNCSIVSPCCGLVFGCRICHDDSPVLPPPFLITGGQPFATDLAAAGIAGASHTMEEVTMGYGEANPKHASRSASLPSNFTEEESHHNINRFLIKEVICRECFTRQSSKT